MIEATELNYYVFTSAFSSQNFAAFWFPLFLAYCFALTNIIILIKQIFPSKTNEPRKRYKKKKSPSIAERPPEDDDESILKKSLRWFQKNYVPFLLGVATATVTILVAYLLYQNWGDFPKKPPGTPPSAPTTSAPATSATILGVSEDSWEKGYMRTYERVGIKPKKDTETLRLYYKLMENTFALCEEATNFPEKLSANLVANKEGLGNILNWLKDCGNDEDLFYRRLSYHYYLELTGGKLRALLENLPRTEGNQETIDELLKIYKKTIIPV